MNKPPKTTFILENLPSNTSNWLIGVDNQFFNVNNLLRGIKLIPSGMHLFHYSIPQVSNTGNGTEDDIARSISGSLRYGIWIPCQEGRCFVLYWEDNEEKFKIRDEENELESLNFRKSLDDLGSSYAYMVKYPGDIGTWMNISGFLDQEICEEMMPSRAGYGEVNTMMPSQEENNALRSMISRKDYNDLDEEVLNYSIINFKVSKDPNSSAEQVTRDYLDKSWYLKTIYLQPHRLLSEFQLSFLNFVILGNTASNVQWINILKLFQMSSEYLLEHKDFTSQFVNVFKDQLLIVPEEYLTTDALVSPSFYIQILMRFVEGVFSVDNYQQLGPDIQETWSSILHIHSEKFGITLKEEIAERDENNIEVYSLNNYDSSDEDAPALV